MIWWTFKGDSSRLLGTFGELRRELSTKHKEAMELFESYQCRYRQVLPDKLFEATRRRPDRKDHEQSMLF